MAGMMNNMMSVLNQLAANTVPPPIPAIAYHVAIDGQATGPFDLAALTQMVLTDTLLKVSLVWKPGFEN